MANIKEALAGKISNARANISNLKNYQIFIKGESTVALRTKDNKSRPRAKIDLAEDGLAIDLTDIFLIAGIAVAARAVFAIIDDIF